MIQDFFTKFFSRSSLSTVEYSSGYLLSISYSTICFWIDWVHVYKDAKIKGLDSREIKSLPKSKNVMSVTFQSSPKINRMLITRLICIKWKFTTPDQLTSPSKASSQRFFLFTTTEVFTCSKVINVFKR